MGLDILSKAMVFAVEAHGGQPRKGDGSPMILHAMEAAVVLGDKLSNMRAFYRGKLKLGPKMWELFNQKDPRQHHWYYRSIACALESLADTPAWREYDWLIGQVFEEGDEGPSPGRPEETAKEEE